MKVKTVIAGDLIRDPGVPVRYVVVLLAPPSARVGAGRTAIAAARETQDARVI